MVVYIDAQHLADWLSYWIYNQRGNPIHQDALWELRIFVIRNFDMEIVKIDYLTIKMEIDALQEVYPEAKEILGYIAFGLEKAAERQIKRRNENVYA